MLPLPKKEEEVDADIMENTKSIWCWGLELVWNTVEPILEYPLFEDYAEGE